MNTTDTDFEGSVLSDMNQWAPPGSQYTVKAYKGWVDRDSPIKPNEDGFGYLEGHEFTVVFNSSEVTPPGRSPLPKNIPKPGFFGRYANHKQKESTLLA